MSLVQRPLFEKHGKVHVLPTVSFFTCLWTRLSNVLGVACKADAFWHPWQLWWGQSNQPGGPLRTGDTSGFVRAADGTFGLLLCFWQKLTLLGRGHQQLGQGV